MLNTYDREKLVEAVLFFSQNVKKLGKVKLFKLLYFLDFEHYRDTGRSVTGMEYVAWKMGPVPSTLHDELETPETPGGEWYGKVSFDNVGTRNGPMLRIQALADFEPKYFTKRELRLLHR